MKVKVLIADDDAAMRMVLMNLLTKWGYTVAPTTNATEAWEVLQNDPTIRIAILDWFMPDMTGVQLTKRIREANIIPFHVILLTSRGGKETMLEGLKAGADDFLTKPCDKEVLEARMAVAQRMVDLQSYIVQRLTDAEASVVALRQLRPFLSICGICGKVRDSENEWHKLDVALPNSGDTGISVCCPDCAKRIGKVARPA
ncbi:MAG: response regulator [Verrucomicrobia bacterium]|nr:response regulator [Verrucomicrobiota bacterium]